MTKKMCLALARKGDSVSDTEIVWAKSVRGVPPPPRALL